MEGRRQGPPRRRGGHARLREVPDGAPLKSLRRDPWPWLAVLPVAASALLARHFFAPVPLWDYWRFLHSSLALEAAGRRGLLAYLWAMDPDQRPILLKGALYLLALLPGRARIPAELVLGFAAQVGVLELVRRLLKASPLGPRGRGALLAASATLLFWPPVHARFQLPGYAAEYGLIAFPGLLCLYFLQRWWGRWTGLLLAALACAASLLTHATAYPLPLAVGLALLASRDWKAGQRLAWWGFTAAALGALVLSLPSRGDLASPSFLDGLLIWQAPRYFLECLGPPFWTPFLGLFLFILAAEYLRSLAQARRPLGRAELPWAALVLWCLGAAAITTSARASFEEHPKSVYFGFFVLFCVAGAHSLAVLSSRREHPLGRLGTPGKALAAILLGGVYVQGWFWGVAECRRLRELQAWGECVLRHAPIATESDTMQILPPRPQLAELGRLGGLPDSADLRPFSSPVPMAFAFTPGPGARKTSKGCSLRPGEEPASLLLTPEKPLAADLAVSLLIEGVREPYGYYQWEDAAGWTPPRKLPSEPIGGSFWLFFCPTDGRRASPIRAIRLGLASRAPQPAAALVRSRVGVWGR